MLYSAAFLDYFIQGELRMRKRFTYTGKRTINCRSGGMKLVRQEKNIFEFYEFISSEIRRKNLASLIRMSLVIESNER